MGSRDGKEKFDMNHFIKKTLSNFDIDQKSATLDNNDRRSFEDGEPLRPPRMTAMLTRSESDSSLPPIASRHSPDDLGAVAPRAVAPISPPPPALCLYCGKRERLDHNNLYCNYCINVLENSEEIQRRLLMYDEEPYNRECHSCTISGPGLPLEPEVSTPPPTETSTLLQQEPRPGSRHRLRRASDISSSINSRPVVVTVDDDALNAYPVPGQKRAGRKGSLTSSFASQSSLNRPLCRICQLPGEPDDVLISPCRCSGTMQFVHKSCLVHWLEISTRKSCPSPRCELCGYQYRTHHCLKVQKLHMPDCTNRDKGFHSVFLMMIIIMFGCAILSIYYLQYTDGSSSMGGALNAEDAIVITCSILFFLAFFVAVFTQYRSEATLCTLCFRWWLVNKHWRIRNYDLEQDKRLWLSRSAEV